MRCCPALLLAAAASAVSASASASAGVAAVTTARGDPALAAANALIARVMGPAAAARIEAELLPPPAAGAMGHFTVSASTSPGKDVLLAGTSGVEIASALNHYANKWLNTTFDWNTCVHIVSPPPVSTKGSRCVQHPWLRVACRQHTLAPEGLAATLATSPQPGPGRRMASHH